MMHGQKTIKKGTDSVATISQVLSSVVLFLGNNNTVL
jgi:hypothetical protein